MRPIPVDSDGMVVDERLDGCACAYVTPSHQSPTTVTLPLERRMALLERAQRGDFLIVEDDYEAEANFMHAPTTARSEEHTSELQSLMRISYAVFCLKKK